MLQVYAAVTRMTCGLPCHNIPVIGTYLSASVLGFLPNDSASALGFLPNDSASALGFLPNDSAASDWPQPQPPLKHACCLQVGPTQLS